MIIKRWNGHVEIKCNEEEEVNMGAISKPINATVEITDSSIINQIKTSLFKKPSEESIKRNERARDLLRRARRG
ncbi:hypothetical protein FKF97_10875 [Clostridium perfringens]|nr:hypothetical protein [Clostridium perfringens]